MKWAGVLLLALSFAGPGYAQTNFEYDFLLKGGHVIDARNKISAVRDVAVKDGKIAAVAANIAPSRALKTVDASGLHVTPGLIDIHVHMYPGPKKNDYAGGDWSVYPDGFTLRSCVTTVTDAGSSGWRNFDDFKSRVIDQSKTEVIGRSTWNPARQIQLEQLGNLSVGSPGDIAVLRLEKGRFGFVDPSGGRMNGSQRLACEMTLRDGKVVYDLNGMTGVSWDTLGPDAAAADPRWANFGRR